MPPCLAPAHPPPRVRLQVVVSHSILAFQQQPPGMPLASYVWDAANPNTPEAQLQGTSQLVCAKFNVKDPAVLGAGQYNGQVVLFDTRKGQGAVETTPVDICHRCAAAGRDQLTSSAPLPRGGGGSAVKVWGAEGRSGCCLRPQCPIPCLGTMLTRLLPFKSPCHAPAPAHSI
jgi:hypothetical protein